MEWSHVLTVFAVIATNLGTVLTLYLQLDKKLDKHRDETNAILRGIADEMKEFHTRLAVQDLEFKMRLTAIEEKSKGLK